QDRRVAAEAARLEAEARSELQLQETLEREQQAAQAEREQQVKASEEEKTREQQRQQEQARAARRAELVVESRERNIDINRRLIDIGVLNSAPTTGRFLNKTVCRCVINCVIVTSVLHHSAFAGIFSGNIFVLIEKLCPVN